MEWENGEHIPEPPPDNFSQYWYSGLAELSSFKLEQARYGSMHPGEAVLIFVAEDFSKSKLVKLDRPDKTGNDKVSVMKLNFTKKFNTGLYPYSMMSSVFTPIDHVKYPSSLKLTVSSQEWCGHTFTQLNKTNTGYKGNQYSYFESEGDVSFTTDDSMLEDEIWNLIRIDPKQLPVGSIEMIPGGFSSRLRHQPLKAEKVEAQLHEDGQIKRYSINYSQTDRSLDIQFESTFPFHILAWEETYKSGWGDNARILTTRATRKKTIQLDYWTKNNPTDVELKEMLDLY